MEQHLARPDSGDERLELAHELVVDRLSAGRVEQHGVGAGGARRGDGVARAGGRLAVTPGVDGDAELARERLELLHGRGAVDVDRGEVGGAAALVAQVTTELGGGGGLPRAVETDQHDDGGRRAAELERRRGAAERPDELAVHELDEVLLRREAPQHLLAERVPLHGVDEVAHDRDVHVRFEQRQAHVTERFLDVALRDPPLALQLAEERVELLAEGLEHQGERAFRKG